MRPARLLPLLLSLAPLLAGAAEPVRAVEAFDLDRYAGQWHEIAHLPVSFQKKCSRDITAVYSLHGDGRIGVRNSCIDAQGQRIEAEGTARPVPDHPGQLQVRFAPDWLSWLPLVWADYWVIALDPDYQWAMIGEPERRYLWILSRTPGMERSRFEALTERATQMGYELAPLRVMAPLH